MCDIIRELNNKGIDLQETILNLENQDYKSYWDAWLELEVMLIKNKIMMEIGMEVLRKEGLLDSHK